MINRNIQDEDYGQEIASNEQGVSWPLQTFGIVILACILSILITLTIRFDKWLLR